MELGGGTIWARIISLTNISVSGGVSPKLGGTHVASQLGGSSTTSGELEVRVVRRGMVQVIVLIAEIMVRMRNGRT